MPPKRKGEIEVTTAHGPQINSARQNSLSIEGTSFHQQQPICNSNSSNHLSAVPVSHEIIVSTSILTPSIETISPQTSVIVTSNGAMPMQEEVRLDVAELSTQIPNGSQTERLRPNREFPYPILYDGERRKEYLSLCVPLYQAAIKGDWKAAKAVINKDRGVVRVGITRKRETALHIAAAAKRTAFVKELVKYMNEEDLTLRNKDGNTAICFAAASGIVEIAMVMVEKNNNLPMIRGNKGMTPLYMAAMFGHRNMVSYLYSVTNFESLAREEQISLLLGTISADLYESGSLEFLIILIRSYPDLIWKVDHNNRSLFHIAVLYRHETIFNLIYEIGAIKDLIAAYKDDKNNNILHLAGNLAPHNRLQIVSGAALQMQRELLWFKAVEKIVPPSYIKMKNSDNQTPKDLFTEKHKDLLKEGEKWMKSTATSCMLVATLIATVVFAAVFTLPGGGNNVTGAPTFLEKKRSGF
uniref:PGG domain-containing protein n=1 Tax=Fagus sylvatica TaxID=28930 RepID=A0A2N9FK05_FAGSY